MAGILDKARALIALANGATPAPWRYGALEHGGRCVADGRGYLFAQVDDDGNGRFDWPDSFVAVPRVGECVQGERHGPGPGTRPVLKVVRVTHRSGPSIEVELHR